MSEIADEVGDGMFVTGAAMLLENGDRFRGPGDMVSFIDQLRNQSLLPVPLYRSKPTGIKVFLSLSGELIDESRPDPLVPWGTDRRNPVAGA